nr:multiple pdz domain protein [Hymenolepis microstoma]
MDPLNEFDLNLPVDADLVGDQITSPCLSGKDFIVFCPLDSSAALDLKSEWSEVELICLQNDLNNGLGFGLLGNKTTGVLVRNIVPGGSADLGGNLRPGDLILRVGDVSTRGLSPDQVARILRQTAVANYNLGGASAETNSSTSSTSTTTTSPNMSTTPSVSLLVARPAQGSPTTLAAVFEKQSQQVRTRQPLGPLCIVPTESLDESLECISDLMLPMTPLLPTPTKSFELDSTEIGTLQPPPLSQSTPPPLPPETDGKELPSESTITSPIIKTESNKCNDSEDDCVEFSVILKKPLISRNCGLGLTIVGYVSEKNKDKAVTGIYVKDVLPNGLASYSGKIRRHDQIIKVNGIDLKHLSNKAAANMLKTTAPVVQLTFLRHTSGRVCEQLKQLVSSSNLRSRQASASLSRGFRRKSRRRNHFSQRNLTLSDSKSYGALCSQSEKRVPLCVCNTQREFIVGPMVNSEEESEESRDLSHNLLGPSSCRSLPMLTSASLMEADSTTISSSSNTSTRDFANNRIQINSLDEDPEIFSSTAASMTLNSSPLDEIDEMEIESPVRKNKCLAVGSYELIQLRAAEHYGVINFIMARKKSLTRYVTNIISFANSRGKNKFKDRSLLYFAGRVNADLLKLMTAVWQPIVGPGKEIGVFRVVRPKNVRQLGISLIGSTTEPRLKKAVASTSTAVLPGESEGLTQEGQEPDVEISDESPSRHFVHTVLPGGLFSSCDYLRPGDELLQVNGYRLHGRSHVEVVRCLRCLPAHIELVIARPLQTFEGVNGDVPDGASTCLDETGTTLHVAASEVGSVATGSFFDDSYDGSASSYARFPPVSLPIHPPASKVSEWIKGSQHDMSMVGPNGTLTRRQEMVSPVNSETYPSASTLIGENITHKPVWSPVPLIIMLKRSKPGFGFSISSYDESLLDGSSTIRRTSTLKRAMSLRRRSTIATNLSSPNSRYSTIGRSQSVSSETLSRSNRNSLIIINEIVKGGCVDLDGRIKVGDRLLFVNDKKLTRASIGEAANALTTVPLGYTMIGVSKMFTVPIAMPPPPFSMSSPQFTAVVNSTDDETVILQAVGLLINPVACMVAGYISVMRSHPFYRSAVTSRNKHLWGGTTLQSPQLVANQLVDELIDFAIGIEVFVDEVMSDAFVELFKSTEVIPSEICEHISEPENIEEPLPCANVDYFVSQTARPVIVEITIPTILIKCFFEEVDVYDDEYDSLESIETSFEQSELSQSSEDWLASLEFVRDTEDEFTQENKKDHPLDYYTPISLDMEEVAYHAAGLVVPEMDPIDEKTVIVTSNTLPLGCELDALSAGGVDGCRVVKVLRGGSIERAAALVPGDYITRINSDNLRKVTNAEAFRVLRKASECTSIEIAYFPCEKVIPHRAKYLRSNLSEEPPNEDHLLSRSRRVSLLVDLPPPELIIATEPLNQLFDENANSSTFWTQTRELKLMKLPEEDTWGLSITGPDVWTNGGDVRALALPQEVSQPVFVASVNENSPAGRCGLLHPGDIIIGVNGMDATRVGSCTVAKWIQTANLVSSNSVSQSDGSSSEEEEWVFLYLLVLPLHPSSSSQLPSSASNESSLSASTKPPLELKAIPPVTLATESSAPSGENSKDARPLSFIFNSSTLVRPAFVSSNDSSMEEPTSVASLEQHGDLPEPLGVSNLVISPPEEPLQMPPQPLNDTDLEYSYDNRTDYPIPPPPPQLPSSHPAGVSEVLSSTTAQTVAISPVVTKQPFPSVQTAESQSAWKNIGATQLSTSLAQLTQIYRRLALPDDEIHVVCMALTPIPSGFNDDSSTDCESGLGIRLVGHRDTNSRGVFICSLREGSLADRTPGLQVTDEIVQVNNICVMGLTHVSAKLLISKETEMARRSGGANPRIFLVIRHNAAYNPSVMAKPAAGTAPTGCGHFLHHSSLRPSSQDAPCAAKNSAFRFPKQAEYDYFEVNLDRNVQGGLGLFLVNMNPRGDMGVFVQNVLPTSPAGMSGQVRSWDRIVAIDGEPVEDYDKALTKLSARHSMVNLRFARARLHSQKQGPELPLGMNLPRSFSPHVHPTPILLGVETTVEIIRSAEDLGFSIIGGSDSQMGGVFIEKIHKEGTIDKDGRLQAHDRILAVNGIDLRNVTHATATSTLRETKDRLLLTILRGSGAFSFSRSDVMQTYSVVLQKQPGTAFGLALDDNQSGGVVIANITPGSPASRAPVLHPGDVILEVDGLDVHKASSDDVMAMLKQCSTHVLLKTGLPKPPSGYPIPRLRLFTVLLTNPTKASPKKDVEMSVSAPVLRVFEQQAVSNPEPPIIFGLIFRQASGNETIYAPGNLIIDSIQPDSAAARCGMLQVGDRLLGIDREPVGWLTIDDLQKFSRNFDNLTFDFGRLPHYKHAITTSKSSSFQLDNLDYSPAPSPRVLPTVTETDETIAVKATSPLSVVVENTHIPATEKSLSPVSNLSTRFHIGAQINGDNSFDEDDEKDVGNFKMRQIQLPLPLQDAANTKLGLTLHSTRNSCSDQRVINLVPGSAAAASGLRVGDRIIGFEERLLFALGQDSESITESIESIWRSQHSTPVVLTIVRDLSRRVNSSTAAAPSIVPDDHQENLHNLKHIAGVAATGLGLMAVHHHAKNRRLPKDVGDNLDVQLQAGPPGLLVPGIATGFAAGAFYGGVDDNMGQPYFSGGNGSELLDSSVTLPEPHFDSSGGGVFNEDRDIQPPTANENYGFGNGQDNGIDVIKDDGTLEGECFYDNLDACCAKNGHIPLMNKECTFEDSSYEINEVNNGTNVNGRSQMKVRASQSVSRYDFLYTRNKRTGDYPSPRHQITLVKRRASVPAAQFCYQDINSPILIDEDYEDTNCQPQLISGTMRCRKALRSRQTRRNSAS